MFLCLDFENCKSSLEIKDGVIFPWACFQWSPRSFGKLKGHEPQIWRKRFRILTCIVYAFCAERLVPF
jgi:hypothetical protein